METLPWTLLPFTSCCARSWFDNPAAVNPTNNLNERRSIMADLNSAVASANAEANAVFGKLAKAVEQAAKKGGTINVVEVVRQAGLELDEKVLAGLHIDPVIHILPWLPWHYWFPWRPLWCWWWHRRYAWYRCCPWWWHRCHWTPGC
jgi:hypothetical protein